MKTRRENHVLTYFIDFAGCPTSSVVINLLTDFFLLFLKIISNIAKPKGLKLGLNETWDKSKKILLLNVFEGMARYAG